MIAAAAVVLELPCERDARRALQRGAYRAAARALRDRLGYPGAAYALEALADTLRPSTRNAEDDSETTVVDLGVLP